MRKRGLLLGALLIGGLFCTVAHGTDAPTDDEQAIRALVQRVAAAIRAKDVPMIMSVYVPDESLLVFDVTPPLQYVGAKAYRKDWEDFFAAFPGPVEFEVSELSVTTEGTLGFSHEIDHWVVTDAAGKKITLAIRVTDVYRKRNGQWFIIHEHNSVPADIDTGRTQGSSKLEQ
jgi:uncharacterized protein (TIGR02246 family)